MLTLQELRRKKEQIEEECKNAGLANFCSAESAAWAVYHAAEKTAKDLRVLTLSRAWDQWRHAQEEQRAGRMDEISEIDIAIKAQELQAELAQIDLSQKETEC